MGRPSDAKERLIEAARQVIYSQSYGSVSVDELCKAASVNKSSFYHFFSPKQQLMLVALESQWQWFEATLLEPAFSSHRSPQEKMQHFFNQMLQGQQAQKLRSGYMYGCPIGNLTLELSTQDEVIRSRIEQFFQEWLGYFERMLSEAKEDGVVPATLDTRVTAQALLAYFEGVILLAKGCNDPAMITTLWRGALSLMQFQGAQA